LLHTTLINVQLVARVLQMGKNLGLS